MDTPIDKLYQRLLELQTRLLDRYQAEDLHQLRVTLRRLRSWLKDHPSDQAQRLDRALANLVKPSNAARDWDTLAIRAQQQLPEQHWSVFQQQITPTLKHCHQHALTPLLGDDWLHIEPLWNNVHRAGQITTPLDHHQNITKAQHRFMKACNKVLNQPSVRRWHRLRIKTKNLRYQLEGIDHPSANRQHRIDQLKMLQQHLGEWHDAQVHHQLLEQLRQQHNLTKAVHCSIEQLQQHCVQQASIELAEAKPLIDQLLLLPYPPVAEQQP